MKAFVQGFLLLILYSHILVSQQDSMLIERGRHLAAEIDFAKFSFQKLSMSESVKHIRYIEEIKSPLKNSKFLLYSSLRMSPPPYYLFAVIRDSISLFPRDTCSNRFICPSIIEFVNSLLLYERAFSISQFLELVPALVMFSDPGSSLNKILHNYSDIYWEKDAKISDSLKQIIKSPTIISYQGKEIIQFFVWESAWTSTELKKVYIEYNQGCLNLKIIPLGKFGRGILKM